MKRTCSYCGMIHEMGFECPKKPVYKKDNADYIIRFRNSYKWKVKREEIKKRDLYLCQGCLHGWNGVERRLNGDSLQVHHIEPINKAWDKRLDNDNLITLCPHCHALAEESGIPPRVSEGKRKEVIHLLWIQRLQKIPKIKIMLSIFT